MPKILITVTNYQRYCSRGLKILQDNGCEVELNEYGRPYAPDELRRSARDAQGLIANIEKWDDSMFDAAPNLKIIARFGTGYDSIDLDAARRHGVMVTNTPGLNASAVAEHALALLLSLIRDIPRLNASTRRGEWKRLMFPELAGRTLGILGFGAVGQNLARKASGFGLNLLAYDKFPNREAALGLGVKLVGLDEILAASDFISINLPALPDTRHLIDDAGFKKMKDGVFIVNTARGALVDEAAAARALAGGKLAGMAADVFEVEPVPADLELFKFENYLATPHSASETYENYDRTGLATAEAVLAALAGREPRNRLA
ncbi:MAG: phosphoglycerate dehydrogenase [Planctomycetota bacterium]|nr:phosphoglycerate dehydrogenase [Planctomycetota bacterium]